MEKTQILATMVTDESIEIAFLGTRFGAGSKRDIIKDTLLKTMGDFATGSTAIRVCQDLNLLGQRRRDGMLRLTKKGRRYLYYACKI